MRTFVFLPPLSRGSGGLNVLKSLVRALNNAGLDAVGVVREGSVLDDVPCLAWGQASPAPEDIWLTPEGWPNAMAPGLSAGARCVVWVQNHGMLFSALPEGLRLTKLPLHYLAISDPVAYFIKETVGYAPPVLRPGIDLDVFHPGPPLPASPVRIAWMPRKNKGLGLQIQRALAHRMSDSLGPVLWEEIHGLDQAGVAEALRRSHYFLATGFPEGCPLPPLEAMASGCLVAGFAGHGGWDSLRQAWDGLPGPWFGAYMDGWGKSPGNAMVAPDGDVLAAATALHALLRWHASGDPRLAAALAAAKETARRYSKEAFAANAEALWRRAAAGEVFV